MSCGGEPSQRFEKRAVVPALAAVARAHDPDLRRAERVLRPDRRQGPGASRMCRDARRTKGTLPGSPTWYAMAWSARRLSPCASCVTFLCYRRRL